MNTLLETTTAGAQSVPKTKRSDNLSADGKWRSFPKVPNLLQYVVAGTYYARCKVNGKPVRASLETDVFTTAKLRLPDKLKELRKPKAVIGTFAEGRLKYETETRDGYTSRKNRLVKLAPLSIDYRLRCFGYSIPIACAPGRNGSEPSLALTYASGGGDDWCGMGWQLSIGSIERNTKDGFPIQYSTGNPQTPLTAYDNSKGFLLNLFGKQLKLLPTATTNEFDAEVDTDFLRCVLDPTNNRWLVYDKNGNVYYFGQVAGSRMSNPKTGWSGSSGTFQWALDQVVTATGDNTTVAYTNYNNPVTGQPERTIYPAQITYNGHISNNGYSATYNGTHTITFAIGIRPDERFSYRDGFRTEQNRRLTNIVCSVGSQKVWQYSLGYTTSLATGRSLLSTLTTYGFDANNTATALPVQTFGYQANPNAVSFGPVITWTNMNPSVPGGGSGYSDPYVVTVSSSGNSVSDLVDMDGDGLPDRVVYDSTTQPNQYQVQRNNGTGGFGSRYAFGPASTATSGMSSTVAQTGSASNLLPDDSTYSILNSANGRIRDLDGDGLPDRVMDYCPAINSIIQGYNYVPYTNYEAMLNTGSGFAGVTAWPVANLIVPGDANGVGFTYECVEGGGSVIQGQVYKIQTSVGLLDLNGDGLPDRVQGMPALDVSTYGPLTNLYVQVNTSSNFTGWRLFPYKSQNWNGSGSGQDAQSVSQWAGIDTPRARMIDINGDGLPDHVMFPMNPTNGDAGTDLHPASYFAVEYNDGYAFESINTSTAVPGAFDQWPGVATQQPNNGGSYNGTPVYADSLVNPPFAFMYDLNGDGLPDRVVIDVASLSGTSSYDTWYVYLNNGTGFNTNPIVVTNIYNQGRYVIGTDFPWWSPQCSDTSGDLLTTMIDINGDGLLDRVMKVYDSGNGVANTFSNYFLVQLNTSPPPDLLTNIGNGLGGNLAVTYKPSTAYDNSRIPGSPNLGSELPFIYQTVSTVTENDGINPARTTGYGYAGGYYNGPRREFHGFAMVTVTNPPEPIAAPYQRRTVYYFHQGGGQSRTNLGEYLDPANFAKDGLIFRQETYGNDNQLYHVTINQVNQASLGNARYFPFTQLTFDCDYPGGGTPRITAKQFAYDVSNGNLTNQIEYGEITNFNATNVGNFTFTDVNAADNRLHNTHFTAIGTYILDHPDKENLTDGSGHVIRETDYTYNSSSGEILTKATLISPGYYATNSYGNYTSYGLAGLTTDPVGVQTEITYDSTFNQYPATTRIRATPGSDGAGDFITTDSYDLRSGSVAASTDPMGVTVTNSYDDLQRPTESDKIPVGGSAVWQKKFDYPATLKAIAAGVATNYIDTVENDGVGGFTNRTYVDGFQRPIQTLKQGENNNYRVVSTVYDERGGEFLTTWPSFATTLNYTKPASQTANWTGFDAAGRAATNRLVTATFTSGVFSSLTALAGDTGSPLAATTRSYVNGTDPWWIVCTDADGDVRRYELDAFGRTNEIQEVNGSATYTTTLNYDLADELTNIVDANSENIYWGFDNAGGMISMADPHLGVWKYQRDYAERLRIQTDGCSNVVVQSYVNPATGQQDALGRIQTKLVYALNPTNQTLTLQSAVTNLYDSSSDGNYTVYPGLPFETIDSQGFEKEGYDPRGRQIKTTRYLNMNGQSYTTGSTYDDGDHVTSTIYPNGGPVITNTYFHGGSLNQVSLFGGSVNYYTVSAGNYDVFEHVTSFAYGNGLTTTRTYYPISARLESLAASSVFTRSYQYTAGDDITNLSGTGMSSAESVAYDNVHRIKTYSGLMGNYGFDPVGNMTTNIESGAVLAYDYGVRRGQAVKTVNGRKDLYDLCGNMIVRASNTTNSEALVYDAENQLIRYAQVGTNFVLVKFGYAGDGARLWKWSNLTTNLQVWIGNIYEEKGGKVLFHVFAGNEQICTFETNSPLYGGTDTTKVGDYYHEDSLNSSSALSSSAGSQTEVNVYYPFGQVQTATPQAAFQVSRRFTGQVFDNETGLYYYNARYYDPYLGRFIQADTTVPDLSNPQSYNRYTYCVNDPLRYNDPTGHSSDDDDDDPTDHLSLTLGGNHAVLRQQAGGASAQLYNQSGSDLRTVATVGRTVAEMNPVVGAANGAIGAATGKDAITDAPLTGGERVLAGVGGVVSIIPGEGTELKAGEAVLKDAEKIKGSYVHEFESGAEYVGKGTEKRMAQSGKQLEKANDDKLVKSTFEPSSPNTDKKAFIDEATKIENKGGIENPNLYNQINSPGKKDIPAN